MLIEEKKDADVNNVVLDIFSYQEHAREGRGDGDSLTVNGQRVSSSCNISLGEIDGSMSNGSMLQLENRLN